MCNKLIACPTSLYLLMSSVAAAGLLEESSGGSFAAENVEVLLIANEPIALPRFDDQEASIKVDGRLGDLAWSNVPVYHDLRVTEPDTLAATPYRTDLRILYTERGLYLAFDMQQQRGTLVRRFTVRDDNEVKRDRVAVSLDTSGEGRYGYWMSLALGDNQADGTIRPERQYSSEWDAAWYGATAITGNGWSAEFLIPWSQMAMPKDDKSRRIGVYVSRKVAHLDEKWA